VEYLWGKKRNEIIAPAKKGNWGTDLLYRDGREKILLSDIPGSKAEKYTKVRSTRREHLRRKGSNGTIRLTEKGRNSSRKKKIGRGTESPLVSLHSKDL